MGCSHSTLEMNWWMIVEIIQDGGGAITMSDGLPVVNQERGGGGIATCYRMYILDVGMIECIDQETGLYFNNVKYEGEFPARITLTVGKDSFSISDASTTGVYTPFPDEVQQTDVDSLREQIERKIIPYQDLPPVDNPQTMKDIIVLSTRYFPYTKHCPEIATSVWDWTSANFTRIDYFRMFAYTLLQGEDLPLESRAIIDAIWTSAWDPYTADNAAYMNSFMMVPAESEASVAQQFIEVAPTLYTYVNAEINLIAAGLQGLPRTCIEAVPKLYSGQFDISNLSNSQFFAHYEELPANAGPRGAALNMPINQARKGFMAVGNTVTVKGIISFTDSLNEAMHYSNGMLITVEPPADDLVWEKAAYVTPLSTDLDKNEYIFYPGTQYRVKKWAYHVRYKYGKRVVEIVLQVI